MHKSQVFDNRDAISGTIESVLRLVDASESGLLSESEMSPLSVTELLVAKSELKRQQHMREKRAQEKAQMEAQVNDAWRRPGVMGDN